MVLVGCYAPHPPEGAPCAANGACPSPLMCAAGHCERDPLPEDAFACAPIAAGAGMLTAPRIATHSLDGDLADWPTCFVAISAATNPSRDLDGTARFLNGKFAIARDDAHVYIAAELTGIAPLGDQPVPAIYQNNSISLYLDGDGTFDSMQYDTDAIQIVIDHANRVQAFRNSTQVTAPGLTSAAKTTGTTFAIEVALQPSTFGRAGFAATIGFDLGFEGGDGTVQYSEAYWFQGCAAPACGCTNGMAAPFCDAREFGHAALAP